MSAASPAETETVRAAPVHDFDTQTGWQWLRNYARPLGITVGPPSGA